MKMGDVQIGDVVSSRPSAARWIAPERGYGLVVDEDLMRSGAGGGHLVQVLWATNELSWWGTYSLVVDLRMSE